MTRIKAQYKSGEGDSLEQTNKELHAWLMEQGRSQPELMKMDFPGSDTIDLGILTSDDRKFRIYCWDTETGGSMHFYYGLIQYVTGTGKTDTKSLKDDRNIEQGGHPGYWYYDLHTFHTKSGKTFYLPMFSGRYSTKDWGSGICAYTISGNRLSDTTRFFYTPGKAYQAISYSYDIFAGKPPDPGNVPGIRLSPDKQLLYIPVVINEGSVTNRSLIYRFDGEKFVFTGK